MTKIEEVARVLEPQAWAALGIGDTLAYKNRRTSSLRKARAAVEAMREPTEAMVDAFVRDGHGKTIGDVGVNGYRAMIDAILSEAK